MTIARWIGHPIFAGAVGVFAGGVVIALIEWCGHQLLGPVDMQQPHSIPTGLFGFVLLGWVLGSAAAGAAATRWCGRRTPWAGIVAGLVLLAAAGLNMASFTHPAWVVAAAVLLMPAAAWWTSRAGLSPGPAA